MNNIQDIFVPYNLSWELKKLGFDEPCFAYYDEETGQTSHYEYANCARNVTGGKTCYNDDFLSVSNSQLDEYGAFCAKDEEGEESYDRWTAVLYEQAFSFMENKRIYKNITYDWNEESYRVCSYHLKKRKKVKKNIFKNHKKNKNLLFNSKYNPLNYNLNEICKEN
jgi:hypothetical protein